MPIEQFVDAAQGSSTVFSIAHPLINYVGDGRAAAIESTMPRVLAHCVNVVLRALRPTTGARTTGTRALMVKLTRDAGMIPTGGSDYHGTLQKDVALGVRTFRRS